MMINTEQNQLKENCIYLLMGDIVEVMVNLKGGAEVEAVEKRYMWAHFPGFVQPAFLQNLGEPAQGRNCPLWAGPSHINNCYRPV